MCPIPYKYVSPPQKPRKEEEEVRCPLANADGWARAQVHRGFFPTLQDAITFLDSHKGLTKVSTEGIFVKLNTGDLNEPD